MTNEPELTGLIQPFNMTAEEYQAMYASEPPKNLTMIVYILLHSCGGWHGGDSYGPVPWFEQNPIELLEALAKRCIANSPFPNMKVEVIVGEEDGERTGKISYEVPLQTLQDEWVTHGMYPQVAFRNDDVYRLCDDILDPCIALHTAITAADVCYAMAKSINPNDHLPIPVTPRDEMVFRLIVGDIFKAGLGAYCEALRPLRNEILVKAHATVINEEDDDPRKPDEEWRKFCDAGLVHFLDYVKLLNP